MLTTDCTVRSVVVSSVPCPTKVDCARLPPAPVKTTDFTPAGMPSGIVKVPVIAPSVPAVGMPPDGVTSTPSKVRLFSRSPEPKPEREKDTGICRRYWMSDLAVPRVSVVELDVVTVEP